MKYNETYFNSITDQIALAEEKTAAEIVVVIHPHSGSYRDVDCCFGAAAAWLTLIFMLFSEHNFKPHLIPIELLIIFLAFAAFSAFTPLRRLLTSNQRRARQVKIAAAAAFTNEEITHTRARTGILIYFSALEKEIELIADTGIIAAVPANEWQALIDDTNKLARQSDAAARLPEQISKIGALAARYLPASDDNPDELPNRPRLD